MTMGKNILILVRHCLTLVLEAVHDVIVLSYIIVGRSFWSRNTCPVVLDTYLRWLLSSWAFDFDRFFDAFVDMALGASSSIGIVPVSHLLGYDVLPRPAAQL